MELLPFKSKKDEYVLEKKQVKKSFDGRKIDSQKQIAEGIG